MVGAAKPGNARVPLRVLIVEDSEDDALLLLRELRSGGYEPVWERVETPEAMREALDGTEWDVIISDYRMPRLGAPEALAMVREAGSRAPFIIASGKIGEDVAVDAIQAGAYDYVMKNNLSRLRTTVTRALAEIEEQRRAEKELRESEDRFRSLVQNSSDLITVFTPDGVQSYVSPSIERILGHRQEDLIGGTPADLVHPDDLPVVRDVLAESLQGIGDQSVFEARLRHADGSWRTFEGIATNLVSDPSVGGVVFNARDITERKRFEEDLRRRDAILEAVRFAAERFLTETTWEESIQDVLERLGAATDVSRVYIFENHAGEDGELWGSQRYEWVAPGITAQMDNPLMESIPYRAAGYGRWVDLLGQGELVYGHTRDFPEVEQPELWEQDVLSIMIVPITVEGKWWGQIGFDACRTEREWTPAEMDALRAAANTLGAAVQRKRIEEELRTSEAELRAVFGAMDDLIFVLDEEGHYLKVAPTDPSLLYEPPTELVGKTLHELFPKEQADEFLGHVRRALETRRRVEFEYDLQIDSQRLWFEANVSPMTEDSVFIVSRDITGRRKAEEEIRQQAHLLDLSHEAIFAWEPEGGIVFWNQGCEQLYGFSKQEAVGHGSHQLLKTAYPVPLEQFRAALETEGQWTGELVQTTRDGRQLTVESRYIMMRTEKGRRLILETNRDITEQKKNEETLRESEERFRSAFESAAIGMALVRPDGRWVEVNKPLADILGYSEHELSNMTFQDITHPDDLEEDLENMERLLAGEIRSYQMEKRYVRKDGHVVWVLLSASLVRDARGEPLYGLAQVENITGRKSAEEALTQSERRLRTIVETEPECVKVLGMDGSLLEMNPAGLSMIEADSLEQVRGKSVY